MYQSIVQVREAEEAEKRHNQANVTAQMMIGGLQRPKASAIKPKMSQKVGSPGPSSPLLSMTTPGMLFWHGKGIRVALYVKVESAAVALFRKVRIFVH
jgi:hypothetical protein